MMRCGMCGGVRFLTASSFVMMSSAITDSAAVQNRRFFADPEFIVISGELAVLRRNYGHDCLRAALLCVPEDASEKHRTDADRHVGDIERRPARRTYTD